MSKEFVQLFFPTLTSLLSSLDFSPPFLVGVWNAIFPDDDSRLCSLPSSSSSSSPNYTNNRHTPHRPCLAIAATIGVFIGLQAQSNEFDGGKYRSGEGVRNELVSSINDKWSKSRRAFGFMNVVALILHCMLPSIQQDTNIIAIVADCLWAADCIFTGISSINLILVALFAYSLGEDGEGSVDITILEWLRKRLSIVVRTSMLGIVACLSLLYQVLRDGFFDPWAVASICIEMMYIIPLISATLLLLPIISCTAFNMFGGSRNKKTIVGARVAILGGLVAMAGVSFNATLCHFISAHAPRIKTTQLLYDIYQMPTLVFLGCDIIFGGLGTWVNALITCRMESNKKFI